MQAIATYNQAELWASEGGLLNQLSAMKNQLWWVFKNCGLWLAAVHAIVVIAGPETGGSG